MAVAKVVTDVVSCRGGVVAVADVVVVAVGVGVYFAPQLPPPVMISLDVHTVLPMELHISLVVAPSTPLGLCKNT